MKIKIFTTNSKGEIVLTKKDLEELLNEAYWEGYGNGSKNKNYTITTPYYTSPYYTWTTSGGSSTITLCSDTTDTKTNTATINGGEYGVKGTADIPAYTTTATTVSASL